MPCRTQRRFSALSVNSFGRIKVNYREKAYFVHSELSPSSGKCSFKRIIKTRKPKADSEYANDHKAKATKIAIHPDSSYFMLLSIWYRKSLRSKNLPRKTMHKMPKRCVPIFLPSSELHMCWDSPEVNPGNFPPPPPTFFFLHCIFLRKGSWKMQSYFPEIHKHLVNFRGMNHSPGYRRIPLLLFALWYPADQVLLSLPA